MQDEKRIPTRLPVAGRPTREIDAYGGGPVGGGSTEGSGVNVFHAIWRRKGVVLAFTVIALACGAAYLLQAAKVYSSSSVVYVQQASSTQISNNSEFTQALNSATYLFTQCQLITSTAILKQAVDVPGVGDAKILRGMENPVGYLKSVISAVPAKQGDLIIVTMESPNPQDAATVVNGVVQAYVDYQGSQHKSNAAQVAAILQKEYETRHEEHDRDQQRMLQMVKDNPDLNIRTSTGGGMMADQLIRLSNSLNEAEFRDDDLRAGLAQAMAADPNDLATLRSLIDEYKLTDQLPASSLPQLSMMAQQLKMHLDELRDIWGPASEQVRRTQAALDRAQNDVAQSTRQAAASCLATFKSAAAQADAHVKQIQTAIATERSITQGLSAKEVEYAQLDGEVKRNEKGMDLLYDRIKTLQGLLDTTGPTTISILETGKASTEPVRPLPSKVLGMATVGGLLAGIGIAMLFDKLDQRLRSIEEIVSLLDATILGVVPRIVRRVLPAEAGREIQLRPRSGVAEAFRTIRTAIYFGGEERAVKTILITSPTPGDGKSTCISNLAIAVAQAGRRVLLIDADCRRPVQHKTFTIEETQGLTGILTGKTTFAEAVRPTEIDRLDLLQCGPLPHNPAELLDSQALLDLLGEASRKYDQVLIDSPPVTLVSDARVLAASCDASVLVLRSERSTRRGASLAWNALASVGANLLGVVVNDFARQKDGYGYTYYGYGRYGYAPAAPAKPELNGAGGHGTNGKSVPVVTTIE